MRSVLFARGGGDLFKSLDLCHAKNVYGESSPLWFPFNYLRETEIFIEGIVVRALQF